MKNNMIGLIVGVTLAVVVLGSVLVPSLNQITTTHATFDNSGYGYQVKALEVGDTWTYDGGWYYGDEAITADVPSAMSIIATDNLIIRSNNLARGTTYTSNNAISGEVVEVDSATTLYMNGATYISFDSGYGVVNDGEMIMKTYDDFAYVNGDTELWVTGYTALASASASQLIVHIEGTIDDGFTISVDNVKNSSVTDISVGDYTVNYETVDGYEDLYTITSIDFDVTGTYDSSEVTSTFTYSTFILPEEVTAELSEHLTTAEISLLSVLPIITIAGMVCAFAFAVTRNRDY